TLFCDSGVGSGEAKGTTRDGSSETGRSLMVPDIRIRTCNSAPLIAERDYVLYWMIAFRRTQWNYSLDRAVEWARDLRKPLLIFEPLRIGYQWASDRIHRFVIDGMADNANRIRRLKNLGIHYFPYV